MENPTFVFCVYMSLESRASIAIWDSDTIRHLVLSCNRVLLGQGSLWLEQFEVSVPHVPSIFGRKFGATTIRDHKILLPQDERWELNVGWCSSETRCVATFVASHVTHVFLEKASRFWRCNDVIPPTTFGSMSKFPLRGHPNSESECVPGWSTSCDKGRVKKITHVLSDQRRSCIQYIVIGYNSLDSADCLSYFATSESASNTCQCCPSSWMKHKKHITKIDINPSPTLHACPCWSGPFPVSCALKIWNCCHMSAAKLEWFKSFRFVDGFPSRTRLQGCSEIEEEGLL